ncbi:MAG: urease accessory protein UreD [Acidianus hospitalis]
MLGYLEVNGGIYRKGSLNAYRVGKTIILANPSEVLAHDDEIFIKIIARNNEIITDQGYTKILSNSSVKINVEVEGNFSYIPHPTLFYNGANAEIHSKFKVDNEALIVEVFTLGREGHGEVFNKGKIKAITEIYSKGELLVYDVFRVNNDDYLNPYVMGNNSLLNIYTVHGREFNVERKISNSKDVYLEVKKYLDYYWW